MFTTAKKRGKTGKRPGSAEAKSTHKPATMYSAVEFGGSRPDSSRRMTGVYGKNAKARRETDIEHGANSRRTGRMFNWMKGDSY